MPFGAAWRQFVHEIVEYGEAFVVHDVTPVEGNHDHAGERFFAQVKLSALLARSYAVRAICCKDGGKYEPNARPCDDNDMTYDELDTSID